MKHIPRLLTLAALSVSLFTSAAPLAVASETETYLATFDDLDFNVFTGQKWNELHRSHADNIIVHWPDGHTTGGLEVHTRDLQSMFAYSPDTRIQVHPIRFGAGEWTAVTGVLEGTFTEPMPTADGQSIPSTGKAFKIEMVTIGHWNADGVMDEEWLFWDNLTFMRQIGLADCAFLFPT